MYIIFNNKYMFYLVAFQPSHLNSTPLIILSCIQFSKETIVKVQPEIFSPSSVW